MNIQWDAEKYTSDFSFVAQYGNDVAALIDAPAGSSVLDLGCGSGALTNALREKGYRVIGMDGSEEQLSIARQRYPDISFLQGDATEFTLEEPVDVVFSNAVFHWIDRERQPDMLRCVHNALPKNGQFVFEMGGYRNNRIIHAALADVFQAHGYPYQIPFYFPSIGEYASLLEQAGFLVQYAFLFDRPTPLKGEDGMKDWIQMFLKTPFSVVPTEQERMEILGQAVERMRPDLYQDGQWIADYVRLRMKCIHL